MNNIGNLALQTPAFQLDAAPASDLNQVEREAIARATSEFFTPQRMEYKGFSEELMADAQVKRLSNGLHATTWSGDLGADAPAVLLVHGWCGNSVQMNGFIRPLLASGKRVVAIDLWGHGLSPGDKSDCQTFARGVLMAAAELGPFKHVIGHSLGAAAVVLASHGGLMIDSAVLISPPSILLVMEYFVAHKGMPAKLLEPMIRSGEQYVGKPRSEVDTILLSRRVLTPFLLIHDEKDRRCPIAVSEKLAADNSNRILIKTTGLGHHHIIEAPEVIGQAINYLA